MTAADHSNINFTTFIYSSFAFLFTMSDGSLVFCYGCIETGKYHSEEEKLAAVRHAQPANEFNAQIVTNPAANSPFLAEAGRYELIVSHGCPFAARPWAALTLLGLEDCIRVIRTFPGNGSNGFFFSPVSEEEKDMVSKHSGGIDWERQGPSWPVGEAVPTHMRDIYMRANPDYTGAYSVPVLYDAKNHTIVNNNSLEIAVILSTQFKAFQKNTSLDLFPTHGDDTVATAMRSKFQEIHGTVNIKVYKAHFAQEQEEYEKHVREFFVTLDEYEKILGTQDFILGTDKPSICDIQLMTTLVRMPLVYSTLFRISYKHMNERCYPNLTKFVRRLHDMADLSQCLQLQGILTNYYTSVPINKKAGKTVPLAPENVFDYF